MNTLRAFGLSIALVLAPLAAHAVTLSTSNSIVVGETVRMIEDRSWHWDANFANRDLAGTYVFAFQNAGAQSRSMDFVFNVRQLSAYFTKGVKITFGSLVYSVAQGVWQNGGATNETNYLVFAPGETKTLTVSFGRVRVVGATQGAAANINFDAITPSQFAAPVPVPAAGLMLASALGGLAAWRRYRPSAGSARTRDVGVPNPGPLVCRSGREHKA